MGAVLAIDDDRVSLELRKLLLERRGHRVTIASDAVTAREAFRAGKFDVVVTDIRLPDAEDGLTLIREFRAARSTVRIVVLCGVISDIEGREEASMVDAILTKPVRSENLLKAVERGF